MNIYFWVGVFHCVNKLTYQWVRFLPYSILLSRNPFAVSSSPFFCFVTFLQYNEVETFISFSFIILAFLFVVWRWRNNFTKNKLHFCRRNVVIIIYHFTKRQQTVRLLAKCLFKASENMDFALRVKLCTFLFSVVKFLWLFIGMTFAENSMKKIMLKQKRNHYHLNEVWFVMKEIQFSKKKKMRFN